MRYLLSITILVILSACTYVPANIPIVTITKDSQTNAIVGLKCTYRYVDNGSVVGVAYTDSDGVGTLIIQYDQRKDGKTTEQIIDMYQIDIEDIDGTNNLGDFYSTNVRAPNYLPSTTNAWVFMIKK